MGESGRKRGIASSELNDSMSNGITLKGEEATWGLKPGATGGFEKDGKNKKNKKKKKKKRTGKIKMENWKCQEPRKEIK